MRIVSLVPGVTETLIALGAEASLVGRTHECPFSTVASIPVVTLAGQPPLPIDAFDATSATAVIQHSLSQRYQINSAELAALKPDWILTRYPTTHMPENWDDVQRWALDSLNLVDTRLQQINPTSVQDAIEDIRMIAQRVNQVDAGARLVDQLQRQMVMIAQRAKMTPSKPSVVMIGQLSPLMTIGDWIPSVMSMAGADNLFGFTGQGATFLELSDLAVADPDIIIVANPGCDLIALQKTFETWSGQAEWRSLRAVQQEQVYLVDTRSYFEHPGVHLSVTLEILAEICHPTHFGFGHEGKRWLCVR